MNTLRKTLTKLLLVLVTVSIISLFLNVKVYAKEDYSYKIKHYAGNAGFSFYINDENKLFSIGENGSGQLGIGNQKSHFDPQHVMDDVKDVIVGGGPFVFAIKLNGDVYAWGKNQHCQLGLGGTYNTDSDTNYISYPEQLSLNFNVKQIVCGNSFALILDDNGNVYGAGSNEYGQLGLESSYTKSSVVSTFTKIDILSGKNIVMIAASGYTSYALTDTNELYSFGDNYYGELGTNSEVKHPNDSALNKCLIDNVIAVSASDSNALALTSDNKVYSWGRNQYSQLGVEWYSETSSLKPIEIMNYYDGESLINVTPSKILSCGNTNFIISTDNDLFSFGANNESNAGIDNGKQTVLVPTKVTFYKALDIQKMKEDGESDVVLSSVPVDKDVIIKLKVSNFAGGCISRVFITDDSGEVWSFGNNSATQLCIGNTATSNVPVKATLYRIDSYDGEYKEKDYLTWPIIFLSIVFTGLIVFIVYSEIKIYKVKKRSKENKC